MATSGSYYSVWEQQYIGKEPSGIILKSNHCYRNASFAALFHLPKLLTLLEHHNATCVNEKETPLCLVRKLNAVAQKYWNTSSNRLNELESPLREMTTFVDDFNKELGDIEREECPEESSHEERSIWFARQAHIAGLRRLEFTGVRASQQDAVEFVRWMMAVLSHDQLDGAMRNFISELFLTETKGSWTCSSCDRTYPLRDNRPERNQGIRSITARDDDETQLKGLMHYLKSSWLKTVVQRTCDDCKSFPTADRVLEEKITSTPEYMLLQVASFGVEEETYTSTNGKYKYKLLRGSKHVSNARIPLWLDFKEFRHQNSRTKDRDHFRYKLWSTVYHSGELSFGHYFGVYTGPNGVRKIDNSQVYRAAAVDLTNNYLTRGEDRLSTDPADGETKRRSEVPLVKKPSISESKNLAQPGIHTAPYLLVYKRIDTAVQKAHVDAAHTASGIENRNIPKKTKGGAAKSPALSRKRKSTESAENTASSQKRVTRSQSKATQKFQSEDNSSELSRGGQLYIGKITRKRRR